MMKKIIDWVKENPWLAASLVVGVIVLIWLMRRNSAAATTNANATANQGVAGTGLSEQGYITLQEANLQASQQVQAIQLQAAVQTSAQQSALQAAQAQYANQLSIAQLQAQVSLNQIAANASTSDTATQAALTASLAQTGAGVQTAQIAADEATTIAGYQEQVSLAQIGATNTANSTIAQLVGVLTGQPANPATPTTRNNVSTVVPSAPVTTNTIATSTPTTTTPVVTSGPTSSVAQPAASGSLIPYANLSNEQWYELLALTSNQNLSQVESIYGQPVSSGSNVTGLDTTVAAHSLAQTAYDYYQQGQIVYNPHGSYNFQWAPGFATPNYSYMYSANPWGAPTAAPAAPTGVPVTS